MSEIIPREIHIAKLFSINTFKVGYTKLSDEPTYEEMEPYQGFFRIEPRCAYIAESDEEIGPYGDATFMLSPAPSLGEHGVFCEPCIDIISNTFCGVARCLICNMTDKVILIEPGEAICRIVAV